MTRRRNAREQLRMEWYLSGLLNIERKVLCQTKINSSNLKYIDLERPETSIKQHVHLKKWPIVGAFLFPVSQLQKGPFQFPKTPCSYTVGHSLWPGLRFFPSGNQPPMASHKSDASPCLANVRSTPWDTYGFSRSGYRLKFPAGSSWVDFLPHEGSDFPVGTQYQRHISGKRINASLKIRAIAP